MIEPTLKIRHNPDRHPNEQDMKNAPRLAAVCLALLVLLLNTCKGDDGHLDREIQELKNLGEENPTAALQQLPPLEKEIKETGSEYFLNKFRLLHVRLKDKAKIQPVSADTINAVCQYFEKHGTTNEQAEAHYYLASTYRDLQDFPQAMSHFLQAADLLQKSPQPDALLMVKAYSQLWGIYTIEYEYDEALEAAQKSYAVARKYGLINATTIMDVATSYVQKGDTAHAMEYCHTAWDSIKACRWATAYSDVTAELLGLFSKTGDSVRAEECRERLLMMPEKERPRNFLYGMASYHEAFSPPDSVCAVYENMYNSFNNSNKKANSSRYLMRYYHDRGDYKRSSDYALVYQKANEEQLRHRMLDLTAKMKGEHVYRRNKEAELKAIADAHRLQARLWGSLALFTSVLVAVVAFFLNRHRKAVKELISKDREVHGISQLLQQREEQLREKTKEVEEIDARLGQEEEKMRNRMAQLNMLMKMAIMDQEIGKGADAIGKFKMAAEKPTVEILQDDWKALARKVDEMYPGFIADVQLQLPKASKELLRTCCLLKLGFSNPDIAIIMKTPRQTVWHRVTKLRKIMGTLLEVPESHEKERL